MDVGIIGLGRMGSGVAERLLKDGHRVVVFNRSAEKVEALVAKGAIGSNSIENLVEQLSAPRVVWLYLPSGEVTQEHIQEVAGLLKSEDVVIDGGNSHFQDSLQRAALLQEKGIHFIDVGTSGGVAGRENGFCLMMGGDESVIEKLAPLWKSVACPGGYARMGRVGSGHYVKMVHNAIEYGMMQAYGEGLDLLRASQFGAELELDKMAEVWQNGSIIRSYLGQLLSEALHEDSQLSQIGSRIDDNGEGRWSIQEALQLGIPMPAITASLFVRYQSKIEQSFGQKVVAILRNKFGGHAVEKIN